MGTLISGGLLAILVDAWLWILAIIIAVTIGIVKLILYLTGKYWG